jgi:hypothetical protein
MVDLQFDILLQPYRFSNEEMQVLKQCNRDSFFQRCIPLASILGIGTYYGVQSGEFIQMLSNIFHVWRAELYVQRIYLLIFLSFLEGLSILDLF